jgi:hypothetical protein
MLAFAALVLALMTDPFLGKSRQGRAHISTT